MGCAAAIAYPTLDRRLKNASHLVFYLESELAYLIELKGQDRGLHQEQIKLHFHAIHCYYDVSTETASSFAAVRWPNK